MENRNEHILEKDIVLPNIVQEKAKEAFGQIEKGRTEIMKEKARKEKHYGWRRRVSAMLGICACAAFVLIGVYGSYEKENTEAVDNMFSVKVFAAESSDATENGYVTLDAEKKNTISLGEEGEAWVLCELEDGRISYSINTHFLCKGENIEKITYSINRGAFQIVESQDSIILEGEAYEGSLNVGSVGGSDKELSPEEGESMETTKYYKSFTVSYDKQMNEQTWINICGESDENWDALFGTDKSLEERVAGIEQLVKDVIITCTVHYMDGSVDESNIMIGGGIVTPQQSETSAMSQPYEMLQPYETFVFYLK